MLRYLFALIVLLHGLIHCMGFAKAFNYGNISQLSKYISKPAGLLWLVVAMLFVAGTTLFLLKNESWPVIAIVAAMLSQILIIMVWKDAKFGTIVNMLVVLVAVSALGCVRFEKSFRTDVQAQLKTAYATDLLTEADLQLLPQPVQKYIRYAGAVGKPKVKNMRLAFKGRMRDKGKGWFPFHSVQYNFFDSPARLFFMKATIFGIAVPGYHCYQNATATMDIRLAGLFSIVKKEGAQMDKAETVTLFNDMCVMAPASLIDNRISWQSIDSISAKAIFTNGTHCIAAILYFNEIGELVNFISDDRTAISQMKQYRFSTPVKDYQMLHGHRLPMYGAAVWHYPEGAFVYGEFYLEEITYNVTSL